MQSTPVVQYRKNSLSSHIENMVSVLNIPHFCNNENGKNSYMFNTLSRAGIE